MDIAIRKVSAGGLQLQYREAGAGDPVLLLHGWPTSSFLWRNVMPAIARTRRVIAPDLPGFGGSGKPLDVTYDFEYHARMLDAFLAALGVERLGLAVHDLGGPIGAYWAVQRRERVTRLAFLNTLLYPNPHWTVIAFVLAARTPLLRAWLASPATLRFTMRLGMQDRSRLTPEVLEGVLTPFADAAARKALIKNACELEPAGFHRIRKGLPQFRCPVRVIYGADDRILPDVARTMRRVKADLPQTEVTALPGCGHFLQEDRPEEVGNLLGEFFRA